MASVHIKASPPTLQRESRIAHWPTATPVLRSTWPPPQLHAALGLALPIGFTPSWALWPKYVPITRSRGHHIRTSRPGRGFDPPGRDPTEKPFLHVNLPARTPRARRKRRATAGGSNSTALPIRSPPTAIWKARRRRGRRACQADAQATAAEAVGTSGATKVDGPCGQSRGNQQGNRGSRAAHRQLRQQSRPVGAQESFHSRRSLSRNSPGSARRVPSHGFLGRSGGCRKTCARLLTSARIRRHGGHQPDRPPRSRRTPYRSVSRGVVS